jgi:hypothetical protein
MDAGAEVGADVRDVVGAEADADVRDVAGVLAGCATSSAGTPSARSSAFAAPRSLGVLSLRRC